nr:hypothetical protein GCM10017611_11750 [Rhodococcus wratislaviensis]
MDHAVAVEWIDVCPDRIEPRVGPVAQIGAVKIGGQLAGHLEIPDVHLLPLRREHPDEMAVVRDVDGSGATGYRC